MNRYYIAVKTTFAILIMMVLYCHVFAQKTYVVAVGIDDYKYPEIAPSLPCSSNDVNSVSSFFHDYNGSEVFMLLNKNATKNHILKVLRTQFSKSTTQDEIIFVFSGHGVQGGFTSYEIRTENDVVTYDALQSIMKAAKARRKIVIANACYSGGLNMNKSNNSKRSSESGRQKHGKTDVMFYTSSRPSEPSWEHSLMKNSFFIDRILKGFRGEADADKDGRVTARELFNYVNPHVIRDTEGKQHPQMWGGFDNNMVVVNVKNNKVW